MKARFVLPLLALCAAGAPAAEPTALEARVAPLAKAHKGKVAVAVKHLGSGEEFYLNADDVMPTASLIKLPVMVETYFQAGEGKVKLDTPVTLKKEDKVPGSGILTQHFSDGATFPLRDAVRLMMTYSDNTATNLVLDQIGLPSTNVRMEKLGLPNTKINAKVFRADTRLDKDRAKYGLGSTTAREMVKLLEMIDARKVVSPEACDAMIAHLKTCDDGNDRLTKLLPPGVVVARKTGSVDAVRTDAGIVYFPNPTDKKKPIPVALCILTNDNEDRRWARDNAAQVLAANIARAVYDHFAPKK